MPKASASRTSTTQYDVEYRKLDDGLVSYRLTTVETTTSCYRGKVSSESEESVKEGVCTWESLSRYLQTGDSSLLESTYCFLRKEYLDILASQGWADMLDKLRQEWSSLLPYSDPQGDLVYMSMNDHTVRTPCKSSRYGDHAMKVDLYNDYYNLDAVEEYLRSHDSVINVIRCGRRKVHVVYTLPPTYTDRTYGSLPVGLFDLSPFEEREEEDEDLNLDW